jgi:hypothetical protein
MQSRWILTVLLAVVSACEPDSNVSPAQTADAAAPDAAGPADAADARPAPVPPDAAAALPPDAAKSPPDAAPPPTCNGTSERCARPYNEVAQACTHNAMSSKAYRFIIPTPNQMRSLTEQLDAGVRCLMLDTYDFEGQLYLCHGECGPWGKLPLADGLAEIAAWLEAHPREVVTFILEAYITEAQTLGALAEAGLAAPEGTPDARFPLFHAAGPPGTPWPTLGEMVDSNRRLVVFTDDAAAAAPWHLHWPSWGWETPYNDPTFTCAHGRGDPGGNAHPIFILNHYSLGPAGGDERISTQNNTFESLTEHARRCAAPTDADNPLGLRPTFLNVDHFHVPTAGGPTDQPDVIDAAFALDAP